MKKVGKYILWILGSLAWLFITMIFWYCDIGLGTNTHQIVIIVSGICLALYIVKSGKRKALEAEIVELKKRIEELEKGR